MKDIEHHKIEVSYNPNHKIGATFATDEIAISIKNASRGALRLLGSDLKEIRKKAAINSVGGPIVSQAYDHLLKRLENAYNTAIKDSDNE